MMLNKNILLLLLALFVSGEVFSQSNNSIFNKKKGKERTSQSTTNENNKKEKSHSVNQKARIDTKDGSMFLGQYVGETNSEITIKILTDDLVTFNKEDVKKARTPLNSIVLNKGRFHRTQGLYLHYNIGFNVGQNAGGFMGDIGLGYRINHKFEVQTGIGFFGTAINHPFRQWSSDYRTFFPVYAGGSYNITDGSCRLFAFGRAGYSSVVNAGGLGFNWNGDTFEVSGGAYFEPGIGVAFAGKRAGRSQISISQMFQYSNINFSSVDEFNNFISGKGTMWIRRVGIRFTTTIL